MCDRMVEKYEQVKQHRDSKGHGLLLGGECRNRRMLAACAKLCEFGVISVSASVCRRRMAPRAR